MTDARGEVDLNGLTFPKLLPGHKWDVRQDEDCYSSWECVEISIRRDRKRFNYRYRARTIYLSRAEKDLREAGYGESEDKEPLPDDEQALWRMYVMKHAEAYYDEYLELNRIPLRNQKLQQSLQAWNDELNGT